jgi:hypothetical protein
MHLKYDNRKAYLPNCSRRRMQLQRNRKIGVDEK